MSKFGSLPTDNAKAGASEDSIFYRPMGILSHQYRTQRQSQAASANRSNPNSANRRKTMFKPVGRIALGGGRNRPKTIATNKSDTSQQQKLLRNYKQNYSRAAYDTFKKEDLPPGTIKCTLRKKSLGCNRGYAGHFIGSKGPRFPKSKIRSIREDDLQTRLERILYDKTLNAKRREEEIARCMLFSEILTIENMVQFDSDVIECNMFSDSNHHNEVISNFISIATSK